MKWQRKFAVAVLALVLVFPILSGMVLAHHSKAHYGTESSTTKGTVVEYKWRNPHVFVVWEVKDQTGKSIQWIGELSSVTSMLAVGMTKDSLKPGDEIVVIANPSRIPGSTDALIAKITKADGTVLTDETSGNPVRRNVEP